MGFEQLARKAAFYLIAARDGRSLLGPKRDFLQLAASDAHAVQTEAREKLSSLLRHAIRTSPFYRQAGEKAGLALENISDTCPLADMPILTKDILQAEKTHLVSASYNVAQLETSFTGGSSGTPTSFYRDRHCTSARMGRQLGILELCGYEVGDLCGLIWGAHQDLDTSGGRRWRKDFRHFAAGKLTLSCTVLEETQMRDYHAALLGYQPKVIYGYPSAICHFLEFIQKQGLPPLSVKRILCTAERLTGAQRQALKNGFQGEVFNLYCTREHGCVAFECHEHRGLHIDTGSVHIEILEQGRPVPSGTPGNIVVTDLLNYGMPFIRYNIGDRAALSSEACPCGLPFPLLQSLDGRVTDLLHRRDGSTVSGVMLVDLCMDEPAVRYVQIVQENLDTIRLHVEPNVGYDNQARDRLVREVREYMGEIEVRVVPVDEIPRNPNSGKFQEVVCLLTSHTIPDEPLS